MDRIKYAHLLMQTLKDRPQDRIERGDVEVTCLDEDSAKSDSIITLAKWDTTGRNQIKFEGGEPKSPTAPLFYPTIGGRIPHI